MKPIFVCNTPALTEEQNEQVYQSLNKKLSKDYYVLVISNPCNEKITFELFNSDLEEKDFNDLKNKLKHYENSIY
jgi:hypothetical protein